MAQPTPLDSTSGEQSRELGVDPIIGAPGGNQFLGDRANHHDGVSTLGPGGDKLGPGQNILTGPAPIGRSSKGDPLFSETSEEE
jgi:hypothetical protein